VTSTRFTRPPSPMRWVALTGAALLALLASTGCSASEAGAAAVVDGKRISVADVQSAAADFETFTGQPVAQQQVLYFLVIGPYVVDAAARAGVGVSLDDAKAQLTQRIPDPSESGVTALQAAESVSRLTQLSEDRSKPILDGVVSKLRSADIELSPRYGEFDAEQITITAPQENWIEAPAVAASPSP
jgi:hypothetical protein